MIIFLYIQEEELRKSGEAKYAHLNYDLHVLIEVFAPAGEAYSRMSHALDEIKKFLVPVSFYTLIPREEWCAGGKDEMVFKPTNTEVLCMHKLVHVYCNSIIELCIRLNKYIGEQPG